MNPLPGAMRRIAVFYDGNFFFHVSNYYQYHHERRQRVSVGGLHDFIRDEVGAREDVDGRACHITEAHYFRGRLRASDADDRDLLFRERVFDDVLIREGVQAHYLPMSREGEKDIDVWLALEAYELASYDRFDVLVLIACNGDYLPLVRKLNARGIRVMVLGWDFRYTDVNGYERETRTAQVLLDEATYPIQMVNVIDDRVRRGDAAINDLFVPRREFTAAPAAPGSVSYPQPNFQPPPYQPSSTDDSANPPEGLEMVGTISALRNGYGFITPAIGGENIFFFHADVAGAEFLDLHIGDKVEYISSANERGPCAKSVKIVG
jgi:cold shock CspA family protein